MAMVYVSNEKGEALHRVWHDPGSAPLFLMYRYSSQKCQSRNTINTFPHATSSSSGNTHESDSSHSPNANALTDSYFDAHAKTSHCSYSCITTNTNAMPRDQLQSLGIYFQPWEL